ncbi:MAG: hypothetical protein ACP5FT_00210 [Acidilobus sp.]
MTRDGIIGVEIGLPSPPGYIPIIPKYVICRDGLWSRGPLAFCRVIDNYGPGGVSLAFERSGIDLIYDPLYGALMPYVRTFSVLEYVSPSQALALRALSGTGKLSHIVIAATSIMAGLVGGIDLLGLTGSYAMLAEGEFSDLDFVVYGEEASEAAYTLFSARAKPVDCKEDFGGFKVMGWACSPWRRGLIPGLDRPISWVGVPAGDPGGHCPPLLERAGTGRPGLFEGELTIPGGQPTALLYPPCVKTEEGYYLISYEYNAGGPLYGGGRILVKGLHYEGRNIIVVGSREVPGSLTLVGRYGG